MWGFFVFACFVYVFLRCQRQDYFIDTVVFFHQEAHYMWLYSVIDVSRHWYSMPRSNGLSGVAKWLIFQSNILFHLLIRIFLTRTNFSSSIIWLTNCTVYMRIYYFLLFTLWKRVGFLEFSNSDELVFLFVVVLQIQGFILYVNWCVSTHLSYSYWYSSFHIFVQWEHLQTGSWDLMNQS